jgi:hypothetical protein
MNRALLVAPMLLLISPPAFSQNAPGGDGRDSSYTRTDRDLDDILRALGESGRGGLRRGGGAAFFLRSGDAVVAVRCDPQDSMKACVDSTLTLLERARSAQPPGTAPSGGAGGQPQSR